MHQYIRHVFYTARIKCGVDNGPIVRKLITERKKIILETAFKHYSMTMNVIAEDYGQAAFSFVHPEIRSHRFLPDAITVIVNKVRIMISHNTVTYRSHQDTDFIHFPQIVLITQRDIISATQAYGIFKIATVAEILFIPVNL